jgi:hypothetical protein
VLPIRAELETRIGPARARPIAIEENTMKGHLVILAGTAVPFMAQTLAQNPVKTVTTTEFIGKTPANEWLVRLFLGSSVQNKSGVLLGKIHDLVFDPTGQISTAVIGERMSTGDQSMKPLTTAIFVGLVLALSVVGYLYYQRTSNDVTIQLPKVELQQR